MNLSKRLHLINAGRSLVYTCILVFTLLISLWMDKLISWNIWAVFLPLWIWKAVVLSGSFFGIIAWCKNTESRFERLSVVNFRAMVISTSLHLLLLLFEALVCVKFEYESTLFRWTLVFAPLLFVSFMSMLLCFWAIKNERSIEMELISSVNVLQFTFIAIKLDNFVTWSWLLVFIPLWVILTLAFVFTLYAVITSIFLMMSSTQSEQRNFSLHVAFSYLLIVIPLIIYAILLVEKLEGLIDQYYSVIGIPLYLAILAQLSLSFSARQGNIWWFGLQKDFCQFLVVDACPCLQEYGNISYKVQFNESSRSNSSTSTSSTPIIEQPTSKPPPYQLTKSGSKEVLAAPIILIEMPD